MEKQNMKKKITNYEAPQLTVVEFRMERGYATSFGPSQVANMIDQQAQQVLMDANGNLVAGYVGDDGRTHDESEIPTGSSWTFENGSYF